MIRKLLKYDLKYIYQILIPIYIMTVFLALITKLISGISNSVMILELVANSLHLLTYCGIAFTVVVSFIKICSRFYNNLFSDEAYLTHTLPVKKEQLFFSKFIMAISVIVTTIIIVFITILILYYSDTFFFNLKGNVDLMAQSYQSSPLITLLIIFIMIFLQAVLAILVSFLAILIINTSGGEKTYEYVIFGVSLYILSQFLMLVSVSIGSYIFPNQREIEYNIMIIVFYFILNTVYYFICRNKLKKGVNLN